jgi:diguanylate cyclase (GGDEF)-like protein
VIKISFVLIFLGLTSLLLLTNFITSFIGFPFNVLIQSILLFIAMTIFFLIVRYKFKPLLIIFQKTMKDVAQNDLTLDEDDLRNIKNISNFTLSNPFTILKYINRLLKNQNTILVTACNDRDFISRNKLLQDTIINLNHSIITTENTEILLDKILKAAIDSIQDGDAGSIMVPGADGAAKYISAVGLDISQLKKTNFNFKDSFILKHSKDNIIKPMIVRDKTEYNNIFHNNENSEFIKKSGAYEYPCTLSAPISVDKSIFGVLSIDSKSTKAFDTDDLRLMEYFTSQIALVIKNSRLIHKAIQLSKFDNLTNVHNRHFFEEIARMAFEEAIRYKGQLHIVLFDLDNFKSVNDTYGHDCGDLVLKKFSSTISNSIRGSDVFARFGGDEFIALFRNSDTKNVEKRITGIIKELDNSPLKIEKMEYNIKFSYGIGSFPENGKNLEELLKVSDINMYKNKEKNKQKDSCSVMRP